MNGMRIPVLGKLITECWTTAEQALRQNVKAKFGDRDEEVITTLFHAELGAEFDRVSTSGAVAKAFLSDLKQTFPMVTDLSLSGIASGLIATVSFHPRHIEGETGGDLGIVLVRPDVRRASYVGSELTIEHDYRRGLLCQAKMFQRDSRWGGLSSKQEQTLQGRLSYFVLLLYRYVDQHGERRELAPFAWQLACGATVEQICAWLASNQFPELQDSQQVLRGLLYDQIGTDDKERIAKEIAPPLRRSLVIRIRWKDDKGPGGKVHVQERSTVYSQQQVVVKRG